MAKLQFREESKFTYKNLLDLNDPKKAYLSPLSVICHIDLNAFFAQCEQLRLGLSDKDPVVCQQWNSLIAVSYAARDYGITRMDRIEEAKLKCPNLIPVHTAVFKKGQPTWKYVDYVPSPANHKVSLDPYRREGKKILSIFKRECDLVQKASVDESFMDLGRLVFQKIVEMFPNVLDEMKSTTDKLQRIEKLPDGLKYVGFVINKNTDSEADKEAGTAGTDKDDYLVEDWDDLVMLIGSMICDDLRKKVYCELGYKTSGGIGRVKTIAKLASGFRKPDQQTIVRNDSISNFLKNFKLTDFWSLGGKTGEYIKEELGDGDLIGRIRSNYNSPAALAKNLGNNIELSEKIYYMVRGEHAEEIETKALIKTMGSNKNFRGNSVASRKDFLSWINVFIGELILRSEEIDQESGTFLRATKLTLSAFSLGGVRHSKQCTLSHSPKDYESLQKLFGETSLELLASLEDLWKSSPTKMYPLRNASLTLSNFIDIRSVNTLYDLLGNAQKRKIDPKESVHHSDENPTNGLNPMKKPKLKLNMLETFLSKNKERGSSKDFDHWEHSEMKKENSSQKLTERISETPPELPSDTDTSSPPQNGDVITCSECGETVESHLWQTHLDFHVAMNLESKINKDFEESYGEKLLKKNRDKKAIRKGIKVDKNQSKLPF